MLPTTESSDDCGLTLVSPVINGWTMKPTGWLRGMTFWWPWDEDQIDAPDEQASHAA